jgi:hypothetical protein
MAAFWDFLSKKYLRQTSILGTNEYQITKNKSTNECAISTFEIYIHNKSAFILSDFLLIGT